MKWFKNGFRYVFHDCDTNFKWKHKITRPWLTRVNWKECTICKRIFDRSTDQH